MPEMLVTYVCETCGSDDVLADAWGEWNPERHQWELVTVFESGNRCNNCDDERKLKEIPLSDLQVEKEG